MTDVVEIKSKEKSFRKLSPEKVQEIVSTFYEVKFNQHFSIVRETLSRMGKIKDDTVWQLCHVLHKKGKYYIVHFKQLFELDGKYSSLNDKDILTLKKTLSLLIKWNILELVNISKNADLENLDESIFVDVVSAKDVDNFKKDKYYNL